MQRDLEEALRTRDETQNASKETEKRQKQLETENAQLQEDLSTALRMRKQAESERDELMEDQNSVSGTKYSFSFCTLVYIYTCSFVYVFHSWKELV